LEHFISLPRRIHRARRSWAKYSHFPTWPPVALHLPQTGAWMQLLHMVGSPFSVGTEIVTPSKANKAIETVVAKIGILMVFTPILAILTPHHAHGIHGAFKPLFELIAVLIAIADFAGLARIRIGINQPLFSYHLQSS
jgi:hypothetical protein